MSAINEVRDFIALASYACKKHGCSVYPTSNPRYLKKGFVLYDANKKPITEMEWSLSEIRQFPDLLIRLFVNEDSHLNFTMMLSDMDNSIHEGYERFYKKAENDFDIIMMEKAIG